MALAIFATVVVIGQSTASAAPANDFLPSAIYPSAGDAVSMTTADLDEDGVVDIVTASQSTGDVRVLLGSGDGTFASGVSYPVGENPISIASADFNGDGHTDVAVVHGGSAVVSIMPGDGNGALGTPINSVLPSAALYVASGDFNEDGDADLAITSTARTQLSILLGNGDGSFAPASPTLTGSGLGPPLLADLNSDSHIDIAVASAGNSKVTTLSGDGSAAFGQLDHPVVDNGIHPQPSALATGDLDGDGQADLIAPAIDTSLGTWFPGTGTGFGSALALPFRPTGTRGLVALDFNSDNKLDLAYFIGDRAFYLANGTGGGALATPIQLGMDADGPRKIMSADFNGDGKPDIAIATPQYGGVAVMIATTNPILGPDSYSVAENSGPTLLPVMANDVDPDGPSPEIDQIWEPPSTGSASVVQGTPDRISFTPPAGFCSPIPVTFAYRAVRSSARSDGSDLGRVSVTVTCADNPPATTPQPTPTAAQAPIAKAPVADTVAPTLTAAKVVSGKAGSKTVAITTSEAGTAVLSFKKKVGRKSKSAGSQSVKVVAGTNRLKLRKLKRGTYTLSIQLRNASGNISSIKSLRLKVS